MKRPRRHRPVSVAVAAVSVAALALALLVRAGAGPAHPSMGTVTTAVSTALLGLLVLWHRPGHRIGRLMLFAGVLFAVSAVAAGVLETGATDAPVLLELAFAWVWLAAAPLVLVWMLLILGLPDGEVSKGWRRTLLVASAPALTLLALARYLLAPAGTAPAFPPATVPADVAGPLSDAISVPQLVDVSTLPFAVLPLVAFLGLIARYRSAGPVVRQQLKWVALGVAAAVLVNVVHAALLATGNQLAGLAAALPVVAEVLPSVGIALAALRYRLWSLDLTAREMRSGLGAAISTAARAPDRSDCGL